MDQLIKEVRILERLEEDRFTLWFTDSALPTEDKKERKKKRKRDEQEETTITEVLETPSASQSKKEKKEKRRKMENAAKDTLIPSTPAETSLTRSKTSPKPHVFSTPSALPTNAEATAFLAKHSITIHTPPNVPQVTPIINFSQLDIPSDLRSSFDGFREPTPIQACTWPPALEGRDVVGIAETGRYVSKFISSTGLMSDIVEKPLHSESQHCLAWSNQPLKAPEHRLCLF